MHSFYGSSYGSFYLLYIFIMRNYRFKLKLPGIDFVVEREIYFG